MGARMPAFLIEVGYLSNSADAGRLKNKKYLESLADGIAEGLLAYRVKINSIKP
jgi:N-acetylmuramoyl-L-alanine amidase